jgi:hypothetical protein
MLLVLKSTDWSLSPTAIYEHISEQQKNSAASLGLFSLAVSSGHHGQTVGNLFQVGARLTDGLSLLHEVAAPLLQRGGGGAQSSLGWRGTHPCRRVWKRVETRGRGGNLLCGRLGKLTAQHRDTIDNSVVEP